VLAKLSNDSTIWDIECLICNIHTRVKITHNSSDDEIPRFCPMCGSDADAEEIDDFEE